jgi:hypothetical protein
VKENVAKGCGSAHMLPRFDDLEGVGEGGREKLGDGAAKECGEGDLEFVSCNRPRWTRVLRCAAASLYATN